MGFPTPDPSPRLRSGLAQDATDCGNSSSGFPAETKRNIPQPVTLSAAEGPKFVERIHPEMILDPSPLRLAQDATDCGNSSSGFPAPVPSPRLRSGLAQDDIVRVCHSRPKTCHSESSEESKIVLEHPWRTYTTTLDTSPLRLARQDNLEPAVVIQA